MLDHIITHLEVADAYAANATRIAALKRRSKHLLDIQNRCREAAARERAEAAGHAKAFGIADLVIAEELAAWHRLRQYSLDRPEALSIADVRWLRAVARHGRPGSRNVRRAAELLYLAEALVCGG